METQPAAPAAPTKRAPVPREALVPRRWLGLARVLWLGLVLAALIVFAFSLSAGYAGLLRTAETSLTPELARLGLSPVDFARYGIILQVGFALGFFVVALVVFARRAGHRGALLFSLLLVAFGVGLPGTTYALLTGQPIWELPTSSLQIVGWMSLLLFGYLFPDARFIPRWTRPLSVLWVAWVAAFFLGANALFAGRPALVAASFLVWVAWFATGAFAQLYRFAFIATPPQRQQTKWVVFGFVLAVLIAGLATTPHIIALTLGQADATSVTYRLVAAAVLSLGIQLIPLCIGIAILRHRLFDIDFIINRALVYGVLSVLLAAVYFGCVLVLQALLRGLADQGSALAVAIATLAIAALFHPLRERIQRGIDHRFFRRKYDAARTIEAFAASLHAEVDLARLSEHLLTVTAEIMQPTHLSLWMPPAESTPSPQEHSPEEG